MNARHRVCCICGKRHGSTQGYRTILARAGFKDRGWGTDKATPSCLRKFLAKQAAALPKVWALYVPDQGHWFNGIEAPSERAERFWDV